MRERGFVLSVILILAAAMFSGMITESEGPSGQFRSHTKNIDVGNLKEQYNTALNAENEFMNDRCVNAGGLYGKKDRSVCKCGRKTMDWKIYNCVNGNLQLNSH
jgi:hypothetical protein